MVILSTIMRQRARSPLRSFGSGPFLFPAKVLNTSRSAGNLTENIDALPASGTRPDRTARRKTSPAKGLADDRRAAFISPSCGGSALRPPPHYPKCDVPRPAAKEYERGHRSLSQNARRANRLSECGAMAERSVTARMIGVRVGCASGDRRPAAELISAGAMKSGARVQACGSATATTTLSTRSLPTSRASGATWDRVSARSVRLVVKCFSYHRGAAC